MHDKENWWLITCIPSKHMHIHTHTHIDTKRMEKREGREREDIYTRTHKDICAIDTET